MTLRDLIERRVSVRRFLPDPVPLEHVREMVRLAGMAPSPNNAQPWRFIAITDRALLTRMAVAVQDRLRALLPVPTEERLRQAATQVERCSTFFAEAPVVIAALLHPYEAVVNELLTGARVTPEQFNDLRGRPDIQCLGAAVEHLLLAATELGYGACWLCGPMVAREQLEALLGVDPPERLAALVALGRPATPPARPSERKDLGEILCFRE